MENRTALPPRPPLRDLAGLLALGAGVAVGASLALAAVVLLLA